MKSAADASGSWSEPRGASGARALTFVLVFFAVVVMVRAITLSATKASWPGTSASRTCPAAEAVLDGILAYPELDDPILEDQKGYVYPPQLVLALLPFTPLPVDVARFW